MHRYNNGSPTFLLSQFQPQAQPFQEHLPTVEQHNILRDLPKQPNFSLETLYALKSAGTCFPIIYSSTTTVPCNCSVPPPKIPENFNLKKPLPYINEDNHPLMVMDKVTPTAEPTRHERRETGPPPSTSNENQYAKMQFQTKGRDARGTKRTTPWAWEASRSPSPSYPPKRRFSPSASQSCQSSTSVPAFPKQPYNNKDRRPTPYARQKKDTSAQTSVPPPNAIFINGIPEQRSLTNGGTWDKVSVAIWEKYLELRQKPETLRRKLSLRVVLGDVLKKEITPCELHIVGSTVTGFGCEGSDVDMCVVVSSFDIDQRFYAVEILKRVVKVLKKCEFIKKTELIAAKVPIVKCFDGNSQVEVDLNCNNLVGIRNTHLLKTYAEIDWRVKPLVLIVKLWARYKDINDAKNKSISSYSLTLMVISYLQCGAAPAVLPSLQRLYPDKFRKSLEVRQLTPILEAELRAMRSPNTQSLGELFAGFLDYYAHRFNYQLDAISVRLGRTLPIVQCQATSSRKNDPYSWKYLCIEEPFDLTNTARSVYDPIVWQRIVGVFGSASALLQQSRDLASILSS